MKVRVLRLLWQLPLCLVLLSIFVVLVFKYIPVPFTPLMIKRAMEFRSDKDFHTRHKWVPLEKISPNVSRAFIASEDARFYSHHGFEWTEIRKELSRNDDHPRGCSTISQQTAKNVFTFGKRSWMRKCVESWFTLLIEWIWGKDRILEVYLNSIEMGKGIYGIAAASEAYFKCTPDKVSLSDACSLAVCLPNPLKRTPAWARKYRAARIRALMKMA